MADRISVGILISGRGSNMEAIVDYERAAGPSYQVILVASNAPEARGLMLARRFGIKTWAHSHKGLERSEFDRLLDDALRAAGVEVVALAGYMRLLSPWLVGRWSDRMLNIHPSLLPLYPGLDTHARALQAGDVEAGCTVHLVTEGVDEGPILDQARVPVLAGDTAADLAARVLTAEHALYPRALADFCRRIRSS